MRRREHLLGQGGALWYPLACSAPSGSSNSDQALLKAARAVVADHVPHHGPAREERRGAVAVPIGRHVVGGRRVQGREGLLLHHSLLAREPLLVSVFSLARALRL